MWQSCNPAHHCRLIAAIAGCLVPVTAARGHGEVHEAILMISQEIDAKPANASLLCERAQLFFQAEHYAEALADLERAEIADPASNSPPAMRGRILRSMGKPAEARAAMETFLQKHPRHAQVRFDYCRTLVDLKETASALRELDLLIANTKQPPPDAVALRLDLTEAQGEGGKESALKWLKAFLVNHPLPVFQEHALRLEIALGQTTAAVHRLDEMISKAPRPETWYLRKADILAAAGDLAGARAAALAASEAIVKLPAHIRSTGACLALEKRAQKFRPSESP